MNNAQHRTLNSFGGPCATLPTVTFALPAVGIGSESPARLQCVRPDLLQVARANHSTRLIAQNFNLQRTPAPTTETAAGK